MQNDEWGTLAILDLFLNKTNCSGLCLRNRDFAKKDVHGVRRTPCTSFFATFPAVGGGCQDSYYLGTTLFVILHLNL